MLRISSPPGKVRSALAAAGCAVTAVLLVLTGPGAAAPVGATGLSIGAGSTMQLGDALLSLGCNDLHIEPTGTLQAQASTIELAGNWDNRGTFDAGTGTVLLDDGCGTPEIASVLGSNTFFDLRATTSTGKTVQFAAGATQTVLDGLTLMGAPGNRLVIRSTIPGQQAFLNLVPSASQLIDYINVADNGATGQVLVMNPPEAAHSIDAGNTTRWFFAGKPSVPALSAGALGLLFTGLSAVGLWRLRRRQVG